ncbi:protein-export chaperone SecB [Asticcacaulis solisilvae]|uniref:protein-export chaperone SecB n=1 Tax=Asticcacaulis solisilvae TaxID=1217274 RepID=UPI003FD72EDE
MTEQFTTRQIYLKDLSFQAPAGASIFTDAWKPQVKIDVKVSHSQVQGGLTEVVLTISVVGTNNGGTAFMIEVLQAGIFHISGFDGEALDRVRLGKCPALLLPYAREVIDSTLMRARFPALILDPIDFEANWRSLKQTV